MTEYGVAYGLRAVKFKRFFGRWAALIASGCALLALAFNLIWHLVDISNARQYALDCRNPPFLSNPTNPQPVCYESPAVINYRFVTNPEGESGYQPVFHDAAGGAYSSEFLDESFYTVLQTKAVHCNVRVWRGRPARILYAGKFYSTEEDPAYLGSTGNKQFRFGVEACSAAVVYCLIVGVFFQIRFRKPSGQDLE